ncbi:MAG: Holliday junction resolvase RuvX [Acidimicrobiales bacterium]|nr:Holliday junction resolvase RuvX [Acidimicrobiales bacterium]
MRVLGIDIGSKKVGLAISNKEMSVATPLSVILRNSNIAQDHEEIKDIAQEWEVELLVVGLPRSLDGGIGPAAESILQEIKHLRKNTGIPVETYDERFTTVTAQQVLREQGVSEKNQRNLIDQVAASIILQAWLDHRMTSTSLVEVVNE